MKLASFTHAGRASYGAVKGDAIVDLGKRWGARFPTLRTAIAGGAFTKAASELESTTADVPLSAVTLLPPIPDPPKIVCVGLNYRDHAAEAGLKVPEFPSVFMRATNTLVADNAPMVRPSLSDNFDYEAELAVIVGKGGRHIAARHALNHVFGYSCFNDGSIRDYQFKHSLIAGKNFPATGAFGPIIVTADEILDPSKLTIVSRLNGKTMQNKSTGDMIFDVPAIIAYLSSWTPLEPGDVIPTGTPEGGGIGRKPPLWMKPGDTIEVEISGIGVLRNPIVAEAPATG